MGTAKGRAQFVNVSCTVSNITGTGKYTLDADTTAVPLRDINMGQLQKYDPVSYLHTGNIAPGLTWDGSTGKYVVDLFLTCNGGAASKPSTIKLPQVALYKTKTWPISNAKQCMYSRQGAYYNGVCQVYWKAKSICVKIGLAKDGSWTTNSTFGGIGCFSNKQYEVAAYEWVRGTKVTFGHGEPPKGLVDYSALTVRVRSGLDPWVDAEFLTNDKMDFGASAKERITWGIILILFGLVLTTPLGYHYYEQRKGRPRPLENRTLLGRSPGRTRDDMDDEEQDSYAMTRQEFNDMQANEGTMVQGMQMHDFGNTRANVHGSTHARSESP